ncbi:coagulation factor XIII A chain-like [Embiotoca jacksoni]|uniref:coagulation factor XIII A chain-like n=1 Tax=Embiotoca jacksoni TaxID=100190 RepID=UPI00370466D8
MSLQNETYVGRFAEPVPMSNLGSLKDEYPEYEPFDDVPESEATPRSYAPGVEILEMRSINMLQQMNKLNHYTTDYDIKNLVCRRGQEFLVRVAFNRPPTPQDDFQLEFLIGSNPSPNKLSLVVMAFGSRQGGQWLGGVRDTSGDTLTLGITPTATALIGKYRMYLTISVGTGMKRSKRDASTDLYLLFNAWNQADPVFLPNQAERVEYVLNDVGVIYQGSVGAITQRDWIYGQFERGILDACIYILDSSRMPIYNRGDVIKLVRKGSAMINSQDDNGVLVGNWSDNYSMGMAPTSWTGSVKILLQYANTGVPVCFAQCWVFAGVFNTFLRCLGIPSRLITNFSSAHDNTGNLKTDLIFKSDGTPDRRNTRDSIWNYHCWNEVFMVRPDLAPGLGGWQVVDATPQETSDGHYRCGPASVAAIKDGLLSFPFDSGFVFAEVNSDVVFLRKDRYGTLTPYRVDKTHVGQALYTKALNGGSPVDVTHTYKHPEGSEADQTTMSRAEAHGMERDHSKLPDTQLTCDVHADPCPLGQDVILRVTFQNKGPAQRTIIGHLDVFITFYTGVIASHFKNESFTVTVPHYEAKTLTLPVTSQEYMPHLRSQPSLQCTVTGKSEDQTVSAIKVVNLLTPNLKMEVSGHQQVNMEMAVTVSFTNRFLFPLQNVVLCLEGPGLMSLRKRQYPLIAPQGSISLSETFVPRLAGLRRLVATLDSDILHQIMGGIDIDIMP